LTSRTSGGRSRRYPVRQWRPIPDAWLMQGLN
jgi:hypothetical protein